MDFAKEDMLQLVTRNVDLMFILDYNIQVFIARLQ